MLRILAKAGAMKLDEMGLSERNMKIMKKIIKILVFSRFRVFVINKDLW